MAFQSGLMPESILPKPKFTDLESHFAMNNDNFLFIFIQLLTWLEILIQNKVPLSQYRVKKLPSQLLENEIKQTIALKT